MEKSNKDIISSYEKMIQIDGLKSLNLDQIKEYRNALQEKLKQLKSNRVCDKLLAVTTGAMGITSSIATINFTMQLMEGKMGTVGYWALTPPFVLLAASSYALVGLSLQLDENDKFKMRDTKKQIELIDDMNNNSKTL